MKAKLIGYKINEYQLFINGDNYDNQTIDKFDNNDIELPYDKSLITTYNVPKDADADSIAYDLAMENLKNMPESEQDECSVMHVHSRYLSDIENTYVFYNGFSDTLLYEVVEIKELE